MGSAGARTTVAAGAGSDADSCVGVGEGSGDVVAVAGVVAVATGTVGVDVGNGFAVGAGVSSTDRGIGRYPRRQSAYPTPNNPSTTTTNTIDNQLRRFIVPPMLTIFSSHLNKFKHVMEGIKISQ
jgi:hypothetical protein